MSPPAGNPSTPYRVLVVEDDEGMGPLIQKVLAPPEFSVTLVTRGQLGIDEAKTRHPDLIVLDVGLPDLDGFEVCRRLRGAPETADVPILFLTAQGALSNKVLGFKSGGDDYLTKPYASTELLLRVRALVRRRPSA